MKNLVFITLMVSILTGFVACKETDRLVNDANNQKMRELLKETYPSLQVSQIRIEVKDFQDIHILLGDKQLFSKSDEELQKVVDEIATMSYSLYIDNNYLDEGTVTFVQHETAAEQRAAKTDDPKKKYSFNYKDYAAEE